MVRRIEIAFVVCLGIGLLLNPVYLYPDGGGPKRTYEAIELSDAQVASTELANADEVLICPGPRACALETRIVTEGSVEFGGPVDGDRAYDAVRIEDQWYLPRAEMDGNTTTLSLQPVTVMEATAAVAEPIDQHGDAVHRAVDGGTVTTYGERVPAFERYAVMEADGDYYILVPGSSSTHWTDGNGLLFARLVLSAFGAGSLVLAVLIWANRSWRLGAE